MSDTPRSIDQPEYTIQILVSRIGQLERRVAEQEFVIQLLSQQQAEAKEAETSDNDDSHPVFD